MASVVLCRKWQTLARMAQPGGCDATPPCGLAKQGKSGFAMLFQ
jgi:hypothetical protein